MCKPSLNPSTEHPQSIFSVTSSSPPCQTPHRKRRRSCSKCCFWASTPISDDANTYQKKRLALALMACFQNAMAGGVIFGWATIDRTLLITPSDQGGAALTTLQTTQLFAWASSTAMVSSLLLGGVLDSYGPRTCSVLSHMMVAMGALLFAASSRYPTYAVATCCMAFGGPGIGASIIHVANLFSNRFLVMSCLTGSVTISFSVFGVFAVLWERYHWTLDHLFGGYAVLVAMSGMASLWLWPDTPYREQIRDDKMVAQVSLDSTISEYCEKEMGQLGELELLNPMVDANPTVNIATEKAASPEANTKDFAAPLSEQSFWSQLTSSTYWKILIIFITTSLFTNFTIASISTELADRQTFSLRQQHELEQQLTWIMSSGLIGSLTVGWLMDRVGLELVTMLTLLLGQTSLFLFNLVDYNASYPLMVVGFVCYMMFRQFLYPVFIASLTVRLGFRHFGLLLGIGFALSGAAQISMASLVQLLQGDCHEQVEVIVDGTLGPCDHGLWTIFELAQFIFLGALMLIPMIDWRARWSQEKAQGGVKSYDTSWDTSSTPLVLADDSRTTSCRRKSSPCESYDSIVADRNDSISLV